MSNLANNPDIGRLWEELADRRHRFLVGLFLFNRLPVRTSAVAGDSRSACGL